MTNQKNLRRMSWLLCFTGTMALLVLPGLVKGQDDGKLKSAQELAQTLRERLQQDWTPPEVPPYPVLAAEQRDTRLILYREGASDWNNPDSIAWQWDPSKALPADQAKWFGNISECKSACGTSCALVAASGGGVALIRLEDSAILFYGLAGGNTHSIAMTPDGNFISASSTGAFLALFVPQGDLSEPASAPTPIYKKFPYFGAHGVVWDDKRQILWALGSREITAYRYIGGKESPDLQEIWKQELKGAANNGHDLYPAPGYDALMTTGEGVTVFDPDKKEFIEVSNRHGVKSISLSHDGLTLLQCATIEWWCESVFYDDLKKHKVGTYDGAKFYKARWFEPNEFSEGRVSSQK
ncbi:MAG: DUF6528 family protein [Planctomycetia bacterium]|nr:DUF6528 family protein [Planctomycetia bacterium]